MSLSFHLVAYCISIDSFFCPFSFSIPSLFFPFSPLLSQPSPIPTLLFSRIRIYLSAFLYRIEHHWHIVLASCIWWYLTIICLGLILGISCCTCKTVLVCCCKSTHSIFFSPFSPSFVRTAAHLVYPPSLFFEHFIHHLSRPTISIHHRQLSIVVLVFVLLFCCICTPSIGKSWQILNVNICSLPLGFSHVIPALLPI